MSSRMPWDAGLEHLACVSSLLGLRTRFYKKDLFLIMCLGICVDVHGVQKRAEHGAGAVHSDLGAENQTVLRKSNKCFSPLSVTPVPRRAFSLCGCFIFTEGRS